MKNKLLNTLTLLCVILALSGCNKEGGSTPQNGEASLTHNPLEQLRTFKKQIEAVRTNPEAKNGETLPLTDALWDVENYFNLTYSDVESYYGQINEHEFTLSIPTDAQQHVMVYDAVNLYDQVVNLAREALISDEFDDKGFISLSIKEVSTNTKGTLVTFSGKTGERTTYSPPSVHLEGPFSIDDNWIFAAPLGKCDDPDIPSGADEQLQERLYIELIEPFIGTDAGFRNIYVDRRRFIFDGSTYAGVYYNTNLNNLCIEHEYMNDHYNAEKRIISQTIPNQYHLFGYSPISIEINGIAIEDVALTHHNEIEYGVRMEVSKDEFGDIEDLLVQQ